MTSMLRRDWLKLVGGVISEHIIPPSFTNGDMFCFNKKYYDTCLMQLPRSYAVKIVPIYGTLQYYVIKVNGRTYSSVGKAKGL